MNRQIHQVIILVLVMFLTLYTSMLFFLSLKKNPHVLEYSLYLSLYHRALQNNF